MEGYYSAPGINIIIPFAAKHEGCGTEIVVKPEILVNVYGSWPTGTDANKMKADIAEAIKRNIPRQKVKKVKPLSELVYEQVQGWNDISKDPMPNRREMWRRLKPILSELSKAMAEKSPFKKNSVWYIEPSWYSQICVDRLDKRIGEMTFRIGSPTGAFLYDSLEFPLTVEDMKFEDVLAWALAHDGEAYVPQEELGNIGICRPFIFS